MSSIKIQRRRRLPDYRTLDRSLLKDLRRTGAARDLNHQLITVQFCGGLRGPCDGFFLYTLFFLYSFPARIGENVSPQYAQICEACSSSRAIARAPKLPAGARLPVPHALPAVAGSLSPLKACTILTLVRA